MTFNSLFSNSTVVPAGAVSDAPATGRRRRIGEFFAERKVNRVDGHWRRELSDHADHVRSQDRLAAESGIGDRALLEALVSHGFDSGTLVTLDVLPLVEVAWASGYVTGDETRQLLLLVRRSGLELSDRARLRIRRWIDQRPTRGEWQLWKAYARHEYDRLPPCYREAYRDRWLRDAEAIAMASGGVLGIGKISNAEGQLIEEIGAVFRD